MIIFCITSYDGIIVITSLQVESSSQGLGWSDGNWKEMAVNIGQMDASPTQFDDHVNIASMKL